LPDLVVQRLREIQKQYMGQTPPEPDAPAT
jgi:hypothetical protein